MSWDIVVSKVTFIMKTPVSASYFAQFVGAAAKVFFQLQRGRFLNEHKLI